MASSHVSFPKEEAFASRGKLRLDLPLELALAELDSRLEDHELDKSETLELQITRSVSKQDHLPCSLSKIESCPDFWRSQKFAGFTGLDLKGYGQMTWETREQCRLMGSKSLFQAGSRPNSKSSSRRSSRNLSQLSGHSTREFLRTHSKESSGGPRMAAGSPVRKLPSIPGASTEASAAPGSGAPAGQTSPTPAAPRIQGKGFEKIEEELFGSSKQRELCLEATEGQNAAGASGRRRQQGGGVSTTLC